MADDVDSENTFLALIKDVDYSADALLKLFRSELNDDEAVFFNSFNEMNMYDRQEILLHLIMMLSTHLDTLQGEVDTVAPIVAQIAQVVLVD